VYYICDEVRSFDMMDEIEVRSRFQFAHGTDYTQGDNAKACIENRRGLVKSHLLIMPKEVPSERCRL
jgi:hypothetical protein